MTKGDSGQVAWYTRAWPAAILAGLPMLLYAPFLFGRKVLYWGVYLLQFYPWRQLVAEQFRAGHWPLWNPYLGAGTPLAANLQTAAFYPPNAIFLLMPVERAFAWALAFHVALAGLAAYYLGRTLGLKQFGALVAGVAYGLGGYVIAHWVFPSMVYAAAWLPLVLAFTERLISNTQYPMPAVKGMRRWILDIAALALVIGLQLVAGHAQTSFYTALIVAAFGVVRIVHHASRLTVHNRGLARRISLVAGCRTALSALIAACLGVALAAIQLLPTAELAAHSQRAGTLTDRQFAFELSFWPWRTISLLAPDFFGNPARDEYWAAGTYWEEASYAGVLPIILAILAVAAWHRRREREAHTSLSLVPFFGVLAIVAFVLALGQHTPVYPFFFDYVPGFGLFQAPARLIIGYALAVPMLAGIGADTLLLTPKARRGLAIALVAGLGAALAAGAAQFAVPGVRLTFSSSVLRLGGTLALACTLLLARGRAIRAGSKSKKLAAQETGVRRWEAGALALLVADLFAFGWGLAPGTDAAVYHAPVRTAQFLQSQPPGRLWVEARYAESVYDEYVSLTSFGSSTPAYLQGLRESLYPNQSVLHDLLAVDNYDPLTVGSYRDLYNLATASPDVPASWATARRILRLFAAPYVVTSAEMDLPKIYDHDPTIYYDAGAMPEAWIVHQARTIEDPATRLAALQAPAFDPRAEVVLDRAPAQEPAPVAGTTQGVATAWLVRESPSRLVVSVETPAPGYLVVADTYYPGWQATVDGQPAEIICANHAFRAVPVSEGSHSVVMEYRPLSFRAGAIVTVATAFVLSVLTAVGTIVTNRR